MGHYSGNAAARCQDSHQGHILWLPKREDSVRLLQSRAGSSGEPVLDVSTGLPVNEGAYNHPVVVISRPQSSPNTVFFCIITSFRGQPITKALRLSSTQPLKYRAQRTPEMYVPLHTDSVHPERDRGNCLYSPLALAHGLEMQRSCYVNAKDVYWIDWRALESYWGAHDPVSKFTWKLNEASVTQLLRVVRIQNGFDASPTQYRPTDALSFPIANDNLETLRSKTSNLSATSNLYSPAATAVITQEGASLKLGFTDDSSSITRSPNQDSGDQSRTLEEVSYVRLDRSDGTPQAQTLSVSRSRHVTVDYGSLEHGRDQYSRERQMRRRPGLGRVTAAVLCIGIAALCLGYTIYVICSGSR